MTYLYTLNHNAMWQNRTDQTLYELSEDWERLDIGVHWLAIDEVVSRRRALEGLAVVRHLPTL